MKHALVPALLVASLGAAPARPEEPRRDRLAVFGMCGQGFHQEGQGFAELCTTAVQGGRFLSRRLQVLLEAHPLILVRQPEGPPYGERETVEAFALDIGLRVYLGPGSWAAKPYLEVLEGPFYALRRVPATGTTFNFLTQAGGGLDLPLGASWHPVVSARWVHISNGGIGAHNPDWDFWVLAFGSARSF